MEKNIKVCVTGGAGFLGSSLVKKLLERGYHVHATLRNLGDPYKAGILKSLPHAENRLELFEADIYNPDDFGRAIQGCEYVVHMATPFQHDINSSKYQDIGEAAVGGVKSIIECCIKSGTVKKFVYTASIVSASPLKADGSGFKDSIHESCWTPLNISYDYSDEYLTKYLQSKTLAEKEVLSYNNTNIEVVSLNCGLVGGDTILSSLPESTGMIVSQITNNNGRYKTLRFLEELIGKVPIVHVEDVNDAHIFCLENTSINGRFLLAKAYLSSADIASYFQKYHPNINIPERYIEDTKREICWGTTKLEDMGFEYKYNIKMILDESVTCAKKLNELI